MQYPEHEHITTHGKRNTVPAGQGNAVPYGGQDGYLQRRRYQVALGRRPSGQSKRRLVDDCTNASSVGTSTLRWCSKRPLLRASARICNPEPGILNATAASPHLSFDFRPLTSAFGPFALPLCPTPSPCRSLLPCHYPCEATVLFAQTVFLLYNPACLFLTGRYATRRQRRKKELMVDGPSEPGPRGA